MGKLTGRIIEAQAVAGGRGTARTGAELKRLRILAGLTQDQVASRMDVQQAAISKIENGGEIYLSTVERYVEALGASLRLNVNRHAKLTPHRAAGVFPGRDRPRGAANRRH